MSDHDLPPPLTMDGSDMGSRFVSLMQGLSDLVSKGVAKPGQFILTPDVELRLDNVGGFEGVITYWLKTRRYSVEGQTQCVGMLNPADRAWAGSTYGDCSVCQYNANSACNWRHNYFILITKGLPEGAQDPGVVIVSLEGASGGPASREINRKIMDMGGYPFRALFRFTSLMTQRKSATGSYAKWVAEAIGEAPQDIQTVARLEYKRGVESGTLLLPAGVMATDESGESTPF
uniref:Uncharacterized protein n=1 Tax=viral metagenome TaxID=1070528 RepID=A0A6M3XSN9_9ZZZZ